MGVNLGAWILWTSNPKNICATANNVFFVKDARRINNVFN